MRCESPSGLTECAFRRRATPGIRAGPLFPDENRLRKCKRKTPNG
jgi:hypothetical protein